VGWARLSSVASNSSVKVDCNACGKALLIAETTRFATCRDCSSRLRIKRTDGAIYTEVLAGGVKDLKDELARLDEAEEEAASEVTAGVPGGSESILRIVVGIVVIVLDVYWWMTAPGLQSLYVRILFLCAGFWLVVSGLWKTIGGVRQRLHARNEMKKVIARRREELKRHIAEGDDEHGNAKRPSETPSDEKKDKPTLEV